MELLLLLVKIIITISLLALVSTLMKMCEALILKPKRLRSILRKQGIRGPPPSFLLGNTGDMKKMKSSAKKAQQKGEQAITHNCSSAVYPVFDDWRKSYGPIFMFSLGNIQILHVNDPEVVKEISICNSLDFGKPSYQSKEHGPLLGHGILASNGASWAHQRKILSPELYMNKVKGMMKIMVESSMTLVNSWRIESEGGVADVHIDEYMKSFSGDVISRACFGSNYSRGEEIFLKLGALKEHLSKKFFYNGIPGMRFDLSYLNFYCYFGSIEQRSSKGAKSVEIGMEIGNRGMEGIGREFMLMSHGLGYSLSLFIFSLNYFSVS